MDYETATDFEINALVATYHLEYGMHMDILEDIKGKSAITCFLPNEVGDEINVFIGDFCNNPSDAWPIIVENDIEVKPNKKGFDYAQAFVLVQNGRCHAIFSHHCHGVLRAAMIVFLKMKGAE